MKRIAEDAPTNSTGPAVAGTNGDPIVGKGARNKYKERNRKSAPKKQFSDFVTMIKRNEK